MDTKLEIEILHEEFIKCLTEIVKSYEEVNTNNRLKILELKLKFNEIQKHMKK